MQPEKEIRILNLLVILTLAGSILVPVAGAIDAGIIEEYYVSPADSYQYSKQTLEDFISAGALDNEIFAGSKLEEEPMIIYDPNHLVLLHQYSITKDGKEVGFIRAAGSKVLGAPVITIHENPDPIDYPDAFAKSEELIKATFENPKYSEPFLICYSPSRIGIMYEMIETGDETGKVIIDAYGISIVSTGDPADSGIRSMYDAIDNDQLEDKIDIWNRAVSLYISITTPVEGDDVWLDVVPPEVSVVGEASSLSGVRSITIRSSLEEVSCGSETEFACTVPVSAGDNTITVIAEDNYGNIFEKTVNVTVHIGLPPPPSITITGRITDTDGNPVQGAMVTFESEIAIDYDNNPLAATNVSGDDGSYLIEDAVGYSQNIEIQKDGYNPYQAVIVFENLSNRLDIELEPEPQKQQSPGFDLLLIACGLGFVFVFLSARRD